MSIGDEILVQEDDDMVPARITFLANFIMQGKKCSGNKSVVMHVIHLPYKVTAKSQFSITTSFCLGAFTPLTLDGNIIVDGVLASSYAFTSHDIAHFGITPVQWFPEITEWIFGKYNESPIYIDVAANLARILFISGMY